MSSNQARLEPECPFASKPLGTNVDRSRCPPGWQPWWVVRRASSEARSGHGVVSVDEVADRHDRTVTDLHPLKQPIGIRREERGISRGISTSLSPASTCGGTSTATPRLSVDWMTAMTSSRRDSCPRRSKRHSMLGSSVR